MASCNFSNKQTKQMAILYIHHRFSFEMIGNIFNCSAKTIASTLYKGVTECILDDNTANTLVTCIINRDKHHTKSTEEKWENAWCIRKANS